jgi:hypothetical protein
MQRFAAALLSVVCVTQHVFFHFACRYAFSRTDVVTPAVRPTCAYTHEAYREPFLNAFELACRGGHLAAAQWLTRRYGLSRSDVVGEENSAMAMCCKYGHLHVAQWLAGDDPTHPPSVPPPAQTPSPPSPPPSPTLLPSTHNPITTTITHPPCRPPIRPPPLPPTHPPPAAGTLPASDFG